ncbi:MAG: gamma-glutamylcyclotransferase family protein [Candidatus Kapaibacterium sp.]
MLYFAYGSNMNPDRLKERVGVYYGMEHGVLQGYKLTFNKKSNIPGRGYATIEICDDSYVAGIIYKLSQKAIKILDMYEGFPAHYTKSYLSIETADGLKECVVYIANEDMLGVDLKPTNEYFRHIMKGWEIIDIIK